jgi:RNA polymerase sigma factor (sigma-70 family)
MVKNKAAVTFTVYRERLIKFIRSRVARLEDAEDIMQEVFFQFTRMDDLARPIENTAAWLYRVAQNKIINHQNKKKEVSFPVYYDEDEDGFLSEEIADIVYSEETTPENECLRALILDEIQYAINELPKEQREVFEQTEFYNYSVKEIADNTGTPINTVLSRKHYAVKTLRKRLKELYDDVIGND